MLTWSRLAGRLHVAQNLFLFFVFWEAMLIPSYFTIGIWGEERAHIYATMKFLVCNFRQLFFMLVRHFVPVGACRHP